MGIGMRFLRLKERLDANRSRSAVPVNGSTSLTSDESELSLATKKYFVSFIYFTRTKLVCHK